MTDTPPDPPPEPLAVELADDELGMATRRASERLVRASRARHAWVGGFAAWFAVGLIATVAYRTLDGDPAQLPWIALALILLAAAASTLLALRQRRQLLARLAATQSRSFTLALGDDGLAVASDRGETRYRWRALEAIESAPDGIALHFAGFQALWIPARAFAGDAGQAGFLARVEAASGQTAGVLPAIPRPREASTTPLRDFAANLRAGALFLLFRPAAADALRASPGQLVALLAAGLVLSLGFDLILVGGTGTVNWYALPALLYSVPWLLLAPWAANLGRKGGSPLAGAVALAALWLPLDALLGAWGLATRLPEPPEWLAFGGYQSVVWLGFLAWGMAASAAALIRTLGLPAEERMAAILAVIFLLALPATLPQGDPHLWIAERDHGGAEARADYERRIAPAREAALYAQSQLLDDALDTIKPGQPGKPELFLLAVGGNGSQDVFKREVESVRRLFGERFGTAGHSLVLVNNPETVLQQPIASVTALRRALLAINQRMNRDEDVLFLFLTSHGSQDHRFDLSLWPYRFEELTPDRLKSLLDEAGIRYRVVVVSACYSGGFVPPLANDDTLVMSASRADRNSHGCSHEADWTFFGKAYFDEALRQTTDFEAAFATAAQAVATREKAEGLTPSEPQIAVGPGIRGALTRLEERGPAKAP